MLRRIAADSRKVNLGHDAAANLPARLLRAMGADIGALHAASGKAAEILRDLEGRGPDAWLREAGKAAAEAVEADFAEWERRGND